MDGTLRLGLTLAVALLPGIAPAQAQQRAATQAHPRGMMGGCPMAEGMMIGGQMPPAADPETLPAPGSVAAKLVGHYCTQCHGLPSPAQHSADGWPAVVRRMDMRMQWMAHYGDAPIQVPATQELQLIEAYLRDNATR